MRKILTVLVLLSCIGMLLLNEISYRGNQAAFRDATYAQHFQKAAYRQDGDAFDDYRPAYRYGTYARGEYADREWDDRLAADLERGWDRFKGSSKLTWERAKHAVADAFTLDRTRPH